MGIFFGWLFLDRLERGPFKTAGYYFKVELFPDPPALVEPKYDLVEGVEWHDTAILIQGGEVSRFTLQTVRFYRNLYPEVGLVLSTWQGQYSKSLENELAEVGGHLVLSEPPINPGVSNQNLQMVSSYEALRFAGSLGFRYALKTRSDQRFNSPDFLVRFRLANSLNPLPPRARGQNERVVGISRNTYLYRKYGLSDMAVWGRVDDLLRYWDGSLVEETTRRALDTPQKCSDYVCEAYFVTRFLEASGWRIRHTLEDWWDALGDRFVVLDSDSLGFFWEKYSALANLNRHRDATGKFEEIDEFTWRLMARKMMAPNRKLAHHEKTL